MQCVGFYYCYFLTVPFLSMKAMQTVRGNLLVTWAKVRGISSTSVNWEDKWMWFNRYGTQEKKWVLTKKGITCSNTEEGAASAAPCRLLLLVPPTAALPFTWRSCSKMFENDLLQKCSKKKKNHKDTLLSVDDLAKEKPPFLFILKCVFLDF